MARRLKLSEKVLRDAEPLEGKSYQIFDTGILGLAAKVQCSGSFPASSKASPSPRYRMRRARGGCDKMQPIQAPRIERWEKRWDKNDKSRKSGSLSTTSSIRLVEPRGVEPLTS